MTLNAPFGRPFSPPFGPKLSKSASWWLSGGVAAANCIAAYQPKGAANLAASYINLANPGTYNAYEGVAPTWDATTGWTGDGSTQFLRTDIIPANDQTYSMIVRYSGVTNIGHLAGMQTAGGSFSINPDANGSVGQLYNGGQVYPSRLLAGNLAVAGNKGYRNGVLVAGTCGAWTNVSNVGIGILCRWAGSAGNKLAGSIQALAVYNIALSGPQVAALMTAMNLL